MNEDLITQVVDKLGLNRDDVVKEYQRLEEEAKQLFSYLPEQDQLKRAEVNFMTFYKNLTKTDAVLFEGIVLAIEPPNYISKKRIDKIMLLYNENPQEAISKGVVKIINDQPTAVDNIQYWNAGKPNQRVNPGFGKPLKDNTFQRTIWGAVKFEDKLTKFFCVLRDDYTSLKIPLNKLCNFRLAIVKKFDDGSLQLVPRKLTRFEESPNSNNVDVSSIMSQLYPETLLNKIEEIVEYNVQNKIYNDLRLVKGQVIDLNLIPNSGKPSFRLIEESLDLSQNTDIRVSVGWDLVNNIDFGEFSTIMVLGNPWVIVDRNTQNKLLGMTAYGIYPILKTTPLHIEPIQQEVDNEFNEFEVSEWKE